MPTIRLNDLTIANLKTAAVQTDFYCDRTPRFGVRVTKHGTKTFFVFAGTTGEYIWMPETEIVPTFRSRAQVDRPLAVVDGVNTVTPALRYVNVDHLNRPIRMTDAAKAVVWNAVWTPWGQPHSITGTATQNARFPGQWYQLEAGLHYNWHRHYDPSIGRYTQPDPLGFVDGPSVFGYAAGLPHLAVDPDGLLVINQDGGVTMNSYPGPPAGGTEHARQGPGGTYHVHITERGGPEIRMSTETWKPLTPADEEKYNSRDGRNIKRYCENLTDGQKKFFDRVNRQIFHRGGPTVNQTLRIGNGGRSSTSGRGNE